MSIATLFRSSEVLPVGSARMVRSTDAGAKEHLPTMTIDMPIPSTNFLPGSHDVNIILMIKEHVPRRIDSIHKELEIMRHRQQELEREASILHRLYDALERDE